MFFSWHCHSTISRPKRSQHCWMNVKSTLQVTVGCHSSQDMIFPTRDVSEQHHAAQQLITTTPHSKQMLPDAVLIAEIRYRLTSKNDEFSFPIFLTSKSPFVSFATVIFWLPHRKRETGGGVCGWFNFQTKWAMTIVPWHTAAARA